MLAPQLGRNVDICIPKREIGKKRLQITSSEGCLVKSKYGGQAGDDARRGRDPVSESAPGS